MQVPPNYQQYPQSYPPYQEPKKTSSVGTILGIIALVIAVAALVLTLVLNRSAFAKKSSTEAPTFNVENFSIDKTESDYSYSTYYYYDGTGDVVTDDRDNSYIVVLKCTRVSGGSDNGDDVSYRILQVVDGKGTFYTYDSGYSGSVSKPTYRFDIIGYTLLDEPE
jgi:hypothetical protein